MGSLWHGGVMAKRASRGRTSAAAYAGPAPDAGDPLLDFMPVPRVAPRRNSLTPQRQRAFIAALAACGVVTEAARSIGASLEAIYRLRNAPGAEGFRAAWEAALDRGIARLEDVALARAIEGEERVVVAKGEVVHRYRHHNNALLMFLLKNRRSQRYGAMRDEDLRPGHPVYERLHQQWIAEQNRPEALAEIRASIDAKLAKLKEKVLARRAAEMTGSETSALAAMEAAVHGRLAEGGPDGGLMVVGITGAQGSGKTTLAAGLVARLREDGVPAAALSLDDLYRTRAEREELARKVHPLLATRGVPGTHDVDLGLATIAAIERGEAAALPRFDKGADDRAPAAAWDRAPPRTRVLVIEGWCLGARPQGGTAEGEAALREPVNALERDEDGDGRWRRFVDAQLAGPYRPLFERIDLSVMLAAPGFDVIEAWRSQQEEPLRRAGTGMDPAQLRRFIAHYERLTRHLLDDMPARADLVVDLGMDRAVRDVRKNPRAPE